MVLTQILVSCSLFWCHTMTGSDPGERKIGAIVPPRTYEGNFIQHNFLQIGKQHSPRGHFVVHCFVTAVL